MRDLRHAVRMLARARGWTAVVVLSLALGIGANTALFSLVNGLLLTTVPARDPDALVRLRYTGRNDAVTDSSEYGFLRQGPDGADQRGTFSYPMYRQFLADNRTMTDLFACAPIGRVSVVVDGQADVATAFISSGNYYQVLGVAARLGRTLLPGDDRPDAPPAAVISSGYWHTRFGTDPAVVGRTVTVNQVPVTIVGILPPAFTGVQQPVAEPPDIAVPLSLDGRLHPDTERPRLTAPTAWWLQIMGRLRPGATAAQVEGNLGGVFEATARAGLTSYLAGLSEADRATVRNRSRAAVPRLRVESGSRGFYDPGTSQLRDVTILGVVVVLVLLIVCANVANLLLSRSAAREKELSVRLSLGATRGRLVRQLLTESLLLAAAGGALGVAVAWWGIKLLPGGANQRLILDWRVLAFVGGVSVLTGLVFGLAPALRGTGRGLSAGLKDTSRGVIASRSVLGRALLVVQVAISLVLLVGAGLFLRTLHNLRQVDVGFDPSNLVLFRVNPQLNRYDEARTAALYQALLERLPAVPGVRAAALSQPALLSGSVTSTGFFVQGRSHPADGDPRDNGIHRLVVSPNFFDVMGIPLVAGRGFAERDNRQDAPKVAIVNQAAARKYFPGENPVGQRFGTSPETSGQVEIVGVLRDVKYNSVRDDAPPTIYLPYLQSGFSSGVVGIRTAAAPGAVLGAIREAVRQVDPALPMMDVSTQIEQVEKRFAQEKVLARAYALFGGVALVLAAVGLFGLMSYSVARRTGEIGIRMALGAQRADVLAMVMRESMTLVAIGMAAGLALAFVASRSLQALLYGLAPGDPWAMLGAAGLMAAVAALAGFVPARRASRVDPMVALRSE